ncbi:NTP transferase domain-containing protein [Paracoccus stylophorae]|uniref:NTP transferase domain-containing protein n=1 Tax=Paracoccus stylophorae TaxID=659350 RepID=A0ABY7SVE0_9RHOB|nr:sugar phosphate nucleotidyltransferase [Paracoccus stylophorae]WCR10833.1 NTP transferase domain-containing protein [Paracoccus stylophorae]
MQIMTHAFRAQDDAMSDCPVVLLAGGRGTRLHELSDRQCKPALRFGDHGRIMDFSLGNARNSGVRHVIAATQYRPETLHRRLTQLWGPIFEARGGFIDVRHGPEVTGHAEGYVGTAAAVTENMDRLDALPTRDVLILAADHVYRMDYRAMLQRHRDSGADLTIAAAAVPLDTAHGFGIIDADEDGRITEFLEEPANPPAMRDDPARALASMGIYIFRWTALRKALLNDRSRDGSRHDFGFDIVPSFVRAGRAIGHALQAPVPGAQAYWRDVGTLDAYLDAHLDLVHQQRDLALLDRRWPVLPAVAGGNSGLASAAPGGELAPQDVVESFVASHSVIGKDARVTGSAVMQGAVIGRGARISGCILAPGSVIEPDMVIGEDAQEDARWFRRTERGTVLVTPRMLLARSQAGQVAGLHPAARGSAGIAPKDGCDLAEAACDV